MTPLIRWFVMSLSLWITAGIVPGVHMKGFLSAFLAVLFMGLVNFFIKPIFVLLTLPITILSLGLFSIFINALMFFFVGRISDGFWVDTIPAAIFGSIVYWIISAVLLSLVKYE